MKEKINKRTTKDSIEYLELECIVNNRIHDYISKYHNYPKYIKLSLWIFECLKQTMCEVDLKIDYKRVLKENEHKTEKIENQKNELAILNNKQKDLKKLQNTLNSYRGQFKRQKKEIKEKDELIEKMKNYLLKENKMCDFLECEEK